MSERITSGPNSEYFRHLKHSKKYQEAHLRAALAYQKRHIKNGLCEKCKRKRVNARHCSIHREYRRKWLNAYNKAKRKAK